MPAVRRWSASTGGVRGVLGEIVKDTPPGIRCNIGGNGDFFLFVVQALTAANHQAVLELMAEQRSRAPGNTDLGPEVPLLRVPRISLPNGQASQVIRPGARDGHKHVALLGGERTKVRPAQSQVEG